MDIRPATVEDIPAIQEVARRSWGADYPAIVSRDTADEGAREWYTEERIRTEINSPDAHVLVAEVEGDIVGFVHGVWSDDEGHVMRVYVDPDERGAGIGTALLDAVVGALFEQGADSIRGMVLAENELGNEFYRSRGFERDPGSYRTQIGDEFYEECVYVLTERR